MPTNPSPLTLKPSQSRPAATAWAQVPLAALEELAHLTIRAPKSAALLQALASRLGPHGGGVVIASRTAMAELLGVSLPTVERALRLLIEENWVQRIRIGGTPALAINSRVAWTGPRGDLAHAVFQATVIASRTEQDAGDLVERQLRQVPMLRAGELPSPTGDGMPPPSQRTLEGLEATLQLAADEELDPATGEIQKRLPGLPAAPTRRGPAPASKPRRAKPAARGKRRR